MRILFVNSYYFMPQSRGGLARTLDQLARGLQARGHQVSAIAELKNNRDFFSLSRRIRLRLLRALGKAPIICDIQTGFRVLRCWRIEPVIRDAIENERPDVIVVTGGRIVPIVRVIRACGIPIVLQVHDVEFKYLEGDFHEVADLPCVANSRFTAQRFNEAFGAHCDTILPFISLKDYEVQSSRERVLFIHPEQKKGIEKAMEIVALCPEIPFTFVGRSTYETLRSTLNLPDPDSVANLEVLPNMGDMREVYRRTRILLVPSRWEEAFGRVVIEAQVSGIPVISSNRGGLAEAAQDGGILLSFDDPAQIWAQHLKRLWTDTGLYDDLSSKARQSAQRRELTEAFQLDAHEAVLIAAVGRG